MDQFWISTVKSTLQASVFKYLSEVDYLTLIAYRKAVILIQRFIYFVHLKFLPIKHDFHFSRDSVGRWSSFKEVLFENLLCRACSSLFECVYTGHDFNTEKSWVIRKARGIFQPTNISL